MNRWQCLRAGNPGSRHKHKNGIDPVSSKNGECSKEVRAPQTSKTSVSSLEHGSRSTSFDFIMLVACDDEVQWDCMGVLHAANSLKRQADLSAKPKMPLFLTFYQFYLGLGGPFQSGSVHLEYDIQFERVDVKFGTIWNNRQSVRNAAVLVVSAPALFVLFAELFASRRKKTKQHRATIGQFRRNGVSEHF